MFKGVRPWHEVRAEGLAAAHARLRRTGLKLPLEEFMELSESVFTHFTEMEAKEDRDIGDRVKYRAIIDSLFPDLPSKRRHALALEANRAFWEAAVKAYPIRRGAKETLKHLESSGIRMGIVSNHHNYEALVGHLEDSGIASHFESILASEREGMRKPNPAIFARSLKSLGVEKEEAIFVGDSLKHDIVGARAAGIKSVLIDDGEQPDTWATPGRKLDAKPDYVISELIGLREIVGLPKRVGRPARRSRTS